jgi:diacylglycerol kinase family enzyme
MDANGRITRDDPIFIVLNAGSGSHDAEETKAKIQNLLDEAGQRYELHVAENPRRLEATARHAVGLARQQHGIVVAAGGDGTLNAVAQVVLPSGRPFGVLPQGTFNYFGRTLGIPTDTIAAVQALLRATVQPVQVGMINGRVFLVNASLGIYPEVLEDREAYKSRFGRNRFVALCAGIMTILREHRQLTLELESEGKVTTMRTATLFAGNNQLQLEQIGIPDADAVARDRLVLIAVRPSGKWTLFKLVIHGALGQLGTAENVISFAFKRLTVRLRWPGLRRRIKIATDGEIAWMELPLVIQVSPTPLSLLVLPDHDRTVAST